MRTMDNYNRNPLEISDDHWEATRQNVIDTKRKAYHGIQEPKFFSLWAPKVISNGHDQRCFNGNGDESSHNKQDLQLLFLCSEETNNESTLFQTPIPPVEYSHQKINGFKMIDFSNLQHRMVITTKGEPSKEEQLMNERKRLIPCGIHSYQLSPVDGTIIFQNSGDLFLTRPSVNMTTGYHEILPNEIKINPILCPFNPELIAYHSDGNVWIGHTTKNWRCQVSTLSDLDLNDGLKVGLPSYITQEEFDRCNGFWWCPHPGVPMEQRVKTATYYLLCEVVDSRNVDVFTLKDEEQRFPRAGKSNSRSHLKVAEIRITQPSLPMNDPDALVSIHHFDIYQYFDWCEYIVRMDWTPDGQR